MLTQRSELVTYLNDQARTYRIPEGTSDGMWFENHFYLTWKLNPGGSIFLQFTNKTEEDIAGLSIRFSLEESGFTSEESVFVWENLFLDYSLPNGRYAFQFVEPQL